VAAGERLLDLVSRHEGRVLVLISGGASALVCAPVKGISLERKRAVVRRLVADDATIAEINVVRRHLSRIKGGGLLRVARGEVRTIVASDVIGGAPHDVGSGISVLDPTTVADAKRVARRRRLGALPFRETCKKAPLGITLRTRVAASPEQFARALARELRREGLRTSVGAPKTGSVASLVVEYEGLAEMLGPEEAIVFSAEPVLAVRARPGRGGRSTHLAALLAPRLAPGVVFLAGATDGVDGSSETAGAVVDAACALPGRDRAIARFDTGALHRRAKTALLIGPTGLNFADVHVLARL
jgi:hydroxypyruvate reductase